MSSQTTQGNEATERAGGIARFLVSLILFVGGVTAMGWAFTVDSAQAFIFCGGLLAVTLAFFLPMMSKER